MGKNWWEDQAPVQTAGKNRNWWEDQEPHAPAATMVPSATMTEKATALGIVKPGTQVQQAKRNAPPPLLARPQAPVSPPAPAGGIDPLAPLPGEEWRRVDRSQPKAPPPGTIPMVRPDGHTVWIPDPAIQMRQEANIRAANKEYQDYRDSRPDWLNQASDFAIGKLREGDKAIASVGNAAIQAVDPNRKASQFISETITPAAEQFGRTVGDVVSGADPNRQGIADIAASIPGAVTEWGATMARDPGQGLAEATQALEPTHYAAEGYNDLKDSLSALFQGDRAKAGEKYQEATPKLLMGAAGMLPGGSMTVDALKAAGKGDGPSIASQLFKPGPTTMDRAADLLIKKMQADGLSFEDIAKTARSLANRGDNGIYETLSEVAALGGKSSGANLRGFAQALAAVPGAAQEALFRRVAENAEKMPSRVSRSASRATGQDASKTAATLDELETRLREESVPRYEAFYNSAVDPNIYGAEIKPILDTDQGKAAMRSALRNLRTQEASLQAAVAAGQAEKVPALQRITASIDSLATGKPLTPEALDHVKRAFDDQIEAAGHGSYTAGNLRGAKRAFAESVSNATGGTYGEALGFYEGGKRLQEAFDIGLNALKQPTWELERAMNAGMRGSPFSKGEIEAIALGVARHIDDLVEANDQTALTRLSKSKAIKNIETALGDPKAAKQLDESIKRLMANRQWGRDLTGGSQTELRRQAIKDATTAEEDPITRSLDRVSTSTSPPSAFGLAWQAIAKPAANAAKDAYQRLRYPGIYNEEVNAALAPWMSNPLTSKNLQEIGDVIEQRLAAKAGNKKLPPPPSGLPPVGGPPRGGPRLPAPAASSRRPPERSGFGASPEALGAAGGGAVGYIANPSDANGDGVIDDRDRGLNAVGGVLTGALGTAAVRAGAKRLSSARPPRMEGPPPLSLSKDQRVFSPGRPDDLGFITSAENVLANPPPRFRDAQRLTADQWRKMMRDGGASKESFQWQIEPALKRLEAEGYTGDIPKAKFEEAMARERGTLRDVGDMEQAAHNYKNYVAPGVHLNYKETVLELPTSQGQGYQSHNWGHSNVVGHIRTTERKAANGEKVLHVEELQSDLHQEGAKSGYRGDPMSPGLQNSARILQKDFDDKLAKYQRWQEAQPANSPYRNAAFDSPQAREMDDAYGRELARTAREAKRLLASPEYTANVTRPPRAPMENWEEPFIRYALRQAANEGTDVVTFPTSQSLHQALENAGTAKFYDERLPRHLDKVAKSLGVRVESTKINTGLKVHKSYDLDGSPVLRLVDDKGKFLQWLDDEEQGRKLIDVINTVPAIRLTPEAKAKLKQGVIMDAKGQTPRDTRAMNSAPGAKRPPPVQAGFGGGKGPPNSRKGPPPRLPPNKVRSGPRTITISPAEIEARAAVKNARAAEQRARNKYVMRDNRDEFLAPYEKATQEAEAKLTAIQQRERNARIGKVQRKQAFKTMVKHPIAHGLAGGAVLSGAIVGANMLMPKEEKQVMSAKDPRFYWTTVVEDRGKVSSVQKALSEWDEWPEDVDFNGRWGPTSKQALKSWRAKRKLNPDAPMTRKETERLLAGPKGYEENGKWYRGDGSLVSPP